MFNPDRFLATETHDPEPDPHDVAFGFGRRYVLILICFVDSFTEIDQSF